MFRVSIITMLSSPAATRAPAETYPLKRGSSSAGEAGSDSASTARIFRGMGYTSHFLNRVPYDVKYAMKRHRGLEFLWRLASACGDNMHVQTLA